MRLSWTEALALVRSIWRAIVGRYAGGLVPLGWSVILIGAAALIVLMLIVTPERHLHYLTTVDRAPGLSLALLRMSGG